MTELSKPDCSKMEYRYLGNSGLRVSVLGWGSMMMYQDDDEKNAETIKFLLEHGVNFFDTAEIYTFGACETALGKALKKLNVQR